jgi:hypothetical protein
MPTFGGEIVASLLVDYQPLLVSDIRKLPKLVDIGNVERVTVLPA